MGDMNLFSKFLPYAVALDVADNWAKAFEGIYQDPPDWYVSPGGFRTFNPYVFTHSINSVTSDLTSAMTSAPRGSGIGGGGGGGGGGSGGGVPQEVASGAAAAEAGDTDGMNLTLDLFRCRFSLYWLRIHSKVSTPCSE